MSFGTNLLLSSLLGVVWCYRISFCRQQSKALWMYLQRQRSWGLNVWWWPHLYRPSFQVLIGRLIVWKMRIAGRILITANRKGYAPFSIFFIKIIPFPYHTSIFSFLLGLSLPFLCFLTLLMRYMCFGFFGIWIRKRYDFEIGLVSFRFSGNRMWFWKIMFCNCSTTQIQPQWKLKFSCLMYFTFIANFPTQPTVGH